VAEDLIVDGVERRQGAASPPSLATSNGADTRGRSDGDRIDPEAAPMIAIPPALARRVLDAAPDAMVVLDMFGTIWFANRQVSALFGYDHHEIIGQDIEMLMPERFRGQHVVHRGDIVGNVRVRTVGPGLDLYGQRRDGTEFALEISLSPIAEVGRTLVAAVIRDVTGGKRVEAELVVARDAIEAMRELAERANQGRKRFLEVAAHDLRQPLQTLVRLNDTLRRLSTDPGAIEALSQQGQAIGVMSRLLSDLLDMGKLESGAIQPAPTDFSVATIFEELRAEFASIAASKGLQLEIEPCDGLVHGDSALVEQILRNLISNAIEYTREGYVRLRCLPWGQFVRIEVLDTGVGIPPDQLPYIFDEFHQVDVPTGNSQGGHGLGLSVAHRLAKLLRLELDVRSEVGSGSAFSIVLPASNPQAVPDQPGPTASPMYTG
jgi:two-component system, sensor histidine kinase